MTTTRAIALSLAAAIAGCASGPPPPAWQSEAKGAFDRAAVAYLSGDTRLHDTELARARAAVSATGRPELAARVELMDCAVRVASLVFEPCVRFEALRADAAAAERAYADHLAARPLSRETIALLPVAQQRAASALAAGAATAAAAPAEEDPLSRLIAVAVLFRAGQASPSQIDSAVDTASAQGWRRPLLAWLKVQALRARKAGDTGELQRLQRRIALVEGDN
ncbi:MAG: hypothetical protein OEU94_00530 [Aquincola sp.]|nr:hypothetical protein [Aquincola sp.]MDH4289724.1 hypothetical protein [Aquincola sp.]MDH5328889.1 hypothetical protein [Aquincola sp.]